MAIKDFADPIWRLQQVAASLRRLADSSRSRSGAADDAAAQVADAYEYAARKITAVLDQTEALSTESASAQAVRIILESGGSK